MDSTEFHNGLKSDDESNSEFVAGAEHFVRLKKQVGLHPRSVEEPIEKEAEYGDSWGDYAGGQSDWQRTFFDRSPKIQMPQKQGPLRGALQKLGFDLKSFAKNPQVIGAVVGAGLGAGSTFLKHRPQERLGGYSKGEVESAERIVAREGRPETGFLEKIKNRTGELEHGLSRAFREHPVKGSMVGAGVGALSGASLVRALGALGGKKR